MPLISVPTGIAILKWFRAHWEPIVILAIIAAAVLSVYAKGRNDEKRFWAKEVELLKRDLQATKREHQAMSDRVKAEIAEVEGKERARVREVQAHYEKRVHANNAVADDLRVQLRAARAVRPLAPAAAAPTTCRDYEADRTKLPERDQSILVGIGERANKCAIQANTCAEYAIGLYARCSASVPSQEKAIQ